MIPILYEKDEIAFISNGLGRLRDCISAVVTEERNGIYELDFEYPMSAEDFSQIQVGRIVGVTHDESEDVQPFDIVSYSRPINGVVTFHCVHISYRQSYMTVTGSSINSLASAFTLLGTAQPNNPFNYQTDKTSTGYLASADGTPRSVRQMLGGIEGSILDAYGGEYEWDKWSVILHDSRGTARDFAIRYGVNMLDYNEDFDSQGTYSSCVPYWTDGTTTVVGDRQDSPYATITGRGECVPLDVSDKFESQPTKAQVEAMGMSMLTGQNTALPTQNIHVEFVRLQDLGYENLGNLMQCKLCDTINVIFPDYNASGRFKIVKTVWNVLKDRYDSMELGDLSTSLSEALGINNGLNSSSSSSDTHDADLLSSSLISSPTLYNCTGTISHNQLYIIKSKGGELYIQGRLNINSFTRTGANPGISFTLPSSVTTPTASSYYYVGFRAQSPREAVAINFSTNSTTATLTTTESYANASNGTLTFIVSGRIFTT